MQRQRALHTAAASLAHCGSVKVTTAERWPAEVLEVCTTIVDFGLMGHKNTHETPNHKVFGMHV